MFKDCGREESTMKHTSGRGMRKKRPILLWRDKSVPGVGTVRGGRENDSDMDGP